MSEPQKAQAAADPGKYKFSREVAEQEIKKMLDYYEIDIDEIEKPEIRDAIKAGYNRLVKAVRLGRLEIKIENGIQVIQTLRTNGTKITYREIDGTAKAEMDGLPVDAYNKRAHALMGSLSGLGATAIKSLISVDLSLAEVLGLIFLSV